MADQRYSKKRIWNAEQWPFLLVLLFFVIAAIGLQLVNITAQSFIGYVVEGDLGMWLGWGVCLFAVCAICWIVARKSSKNLTITLLCGALVTIEGLGIGTQAAGHFGAAGWEWAVAMFVGLVVGVPFQLMTVRAAKRVASPPL